MYTALFSALIAVCALISVPSTPPFTMQSFAVILAIFTLGSRRAFTSVLVYIFIGLVGVPVFSGFSSGIGVLFGATGGYLPGFLLMPPVYALVHRKSAVSTIFACVMSFAVCYITGTLWFMHVYSLPLDTTGAVTAFQACVLPFILPDAIKTILAYIVYKRIKRTER